MEHFSDFERFLFENNFGVNTDQRHHLELLQHPLFHQDNEEGFQTSVATPKKMKLSDLEAFLIENDFTEDLNRINYAGLRDNPLFVVEPNSIHREEREANIQPRLTDFEAFLINNDFTENFGHTDYAGFRKNPLFCIGRNTPLISTLICKICTHSSKTLLTHLQHMSACRRKQHRRQAPKQAKLQLLCPHCTFRTNDKTLLEYHEAQVHRCSTCNFTGSGSALKKHHSLQQCGGNLKNITRNFIQPNNPFREIKAFKGYIRTYRESRVQGQNNLNGYFIRTKKFVKQLVAHSLRELKVCKMQFSVHVRLRRFLCKTDHGRRIYEVIDMPMNSRMAALLNIHNFDKAYASWCAKIESTLSTFERYGSGWVFSKVTGADLRVGKLIPQRGGCWRKTPKKLSNKKAIINVTSKDEECFKWAVLASLHQSDLSLTQKKNPNRSYYYERFEKLYDFSGLDYPVEVSAISRFEEINNLAVNVFSYDWDDGILPVFISPNIYKGKKTVDLLLLTDSHSDRQHYATITDIHKLLGKQNLSRRLLCYNCLNTIPLCEVKCKITCKKYCKLVTHIRDCREHKYQRIKMPNHMPDGSPPFISFTSYEKQLRKDYVVYADFESILEVADEDSTFFRRTSSEVISYTEKQVSHTPCGFAYAVVDADGKLAHARVYRAADAVAVFLRDLSYISAKVFEIYEEEEEMVITPQQQQEFDESTHCHICGYELGDDRVRDHDHRTGFYRGSAHSMCNLIYFQRNQLPVILHNFRGYDSHFIVHGFDKFGEEVKVTPTNTERFMSVSVDGIVFIDSLQFLNCSLETLTKNLAEGQNDEDFKLVRELFPDRMSLDLLKKKGVYPYEYFKTWDVFNEKCLPSEKAFYNRLRKEKLKPGEYQHAVTVFKHFECRNLGDYHDMYLMTDVLLLASIFESFRNMSLQVYKLDPVHYISAPGLAWDAALRMTCVRLEQLTDIDMYEFFEAGKRGGVSMITKRKAEANNKYMEDYSGDPCSPEQKYIISWDMNNLYGVAMSQKLPVSHFHFLSESEIKKFNPLKISDSSEYGYVIECDLIYPKEYHILHNDYPLAPERTNVEYDRLSKYQKKLVNALELQYNSEQEKLIPHLNPRHKYKVHYRNLKFYLENGMKMTKIYRILTFKQHDWLAPYIDFNTQKRTLAKNKFETDFFKLMNNSTYGKSMENVRKRMSVRLVNKWEQARSLIRKPQYISHDILNKSLCSFRMEYGTVKLNKAIYTGFAVMDLSKLYMYKFHYNYVKQKYSEKAQLLFTDTDSLTYEIKTLDLYQDMLSDKDLFDTSEYPKSHFLYSSTNKKVLGKMHDEANGEIVFKFVGLAPKVYCMVIGEEEQSHEKKALRGVPKYLQDRIFTYNKFLNVLDEEKRVYCKMNQIRSFKHNISTVEICKSVLHGFDSKRYIADDGIHTLAWGHFELKE